jgi:hypothetical protein
MGVEGPTSDGVREDARRKAFLPPVVTRPDRIPAFAGMTKIGQGGGVTWRMRSNRASWWDSR